MPDNNFEKAFQVVIGIEDGYNDDPDDRGGETNFGISKRQYPYINIKDLTEDKAKAIYKRDYWDKLHLGNVKRYEVALELFDTGVNTGITKAVFILQEALNYLGHTLKVDGIIGPKTMTATNKYKYPIFLVRTLDGVQFMHYYNIVKENPSQRKFARGWLKRIGF